LLGSARDAPDARKATRTQLPAATVKYPRVAVQPPQGKNCLRSMAKTGRLTDTVAGNARRDHSGVQRLFGCSDPRWNGRFGVHPLHCRAHWLVSLCERAIGWHRRQRPLAHPHRARRAICDKPKTAAAGPFHRPGERRLAASNGGHLPNGCGAIESRIVRSLASRCVGLRLKRSGRSRGVAHPCTTERRRPGGPAMSTLRERGFPAAGRDRRAWRWAGAAEVAARTKRGI
jgi:hypothetical protein